ncbi:MAG: Ribosomal RNA small subunit methyltransferase D [Syntrophaceae bacterium PtaU1.Bin231]|nr:MAG: Ribosomal RNA small subunit methyltransferase D [Syntrophaceae bacterium PtaU1.Bin231]HOG17746.1 16S rRNA (guanine(966)-N(2))-methyltransferase RsmD [Syntrophales bacterium]
MRIIGGEARGRIIRIPKGCRLRPTSDMVREALFNILPPVTGGSFLDLFAGCGTVGLEAASRGAARSLLVEKDPLLAKAIRASAEGLGLAGRTEVMAAEAERAILLLSARGERFDFVFIDPPYERGLIEPTLERIASGNLLAQAGFAIVQHAAGEGVQTDSIGGIVLRDQRRYGNTLLSFWQGA